MTLLFPVPGKPWPKPFPLENVEQDVAMFLLARGDCKFEFGAINRVTVTSSERAHLVLLHLVVV